MERQQFLKLIESPNNLNSETLVALDKMLKLYPYSSCIHLLYMQNLQRENRNEFSAQLKTSSLYCNRKTLYNLLNKNDYIMQELLGTQLNLSQINELNNYLNQEQEDAPEYKPTSTAELIAHFIENEPGRLRVKKNDDEQETEDLSEKSTIENDEIISETLAQILAKQGKTEQAIQLYEKLCLKIPEKSSYFAAQIKNLKEQLNK